MDNLKRKFIKGFTLAELITVIAIFVLISAMVLFNYNGFQNSISLGNLSDDIALTVRKAQVYAIGSKGMSIQNFTGVQFPGYGLHFETNPSKLSASSANEKSFIFFADISMAPGVPADGLYTSASGSCNPAFVGINDECLDIINITSGDKITDICSNGTCYSYGGTYDTLDVVFKRPESDAYLCPRSSAGAPVCPSTPPSNAGVKIKALNGTTKTITIYNTGQISVQ